MKCRGCAIYASHGKFPLWQLWTVALWLTKPTAKLVTLLEQCLDRQPPTVAILATTWWEAGLALVKLQDCGLEVHLPVKVCFYQQRFQNCQVTWAGDMHSGAAMSQPSFCGNNKHNWPEFHPGLPGSGIANGCYYTHGTCMCTQCRQVFGPFHMLYNNRGFHSLHTVHIWEAHHIKVDSRAITLYMFTS